VGLASTSIKESTERVKAALLALDFAFPAQKITINLSPSDLPKSGSHFDLSIALLIALQKAKSLEKIFVFGELGLDGSVKSTANLFSILLFLSTQVQKAKILVPKEIAAKASMIPNLEVYGVSTLEEAIKFFSDEEFAKSTHFNATHELFSNVIEISGKRYVPNLNFELDFKDVLGQERAKRACVIAAVGMHNILFEGSPGSGKSMCAKRLVYIMAPQSLEEVLKSAAYRSLNLQDSEFTSIRAFRSPHHTSTKSSIFGGGSNVAKIGEIALANGGVLFFDEFPHFAKQVIESLREPLEDNQIHIARVNSKVTYETKFIFVAAHRIDLKVAMDESSPDDKASLSSQQMSEMVLKAFIFQKKRDQDELNGKLNDAQVAKFCTLNAEASEILQKAATKYNLSQRGIKRTLRVARSIADLDESEQILKSHILEALSFRA